VAKCSGLSFDENSAFQRPEATAHFSVKDLDSKGREKSDLGGSINRLSLSLDEKPS
jgi:hypothetical protein